MKCYACYVMNLKYSSAADDNGNLALWRPVIKEFVKAIQIVDAARALVPYSNGKIFRDNVSCTSVNVLICMQESRPIGRLHQCCLLSFREPTISFPTKNIL